MAIVGGGPIPGRTIFGLMGLRLGFMGGGGPIPGLMIGGAFICGLPRGGAPPCNGGCSMRASGMDTAGCEDIFATRYLGSRLRISSCTRQAHIITSNQSETRARTPLKLTPGTAHFHHSSHRDDTAMHQNHHYCGYTLPDQTQCMRSTHH